MFTVDFNRVLNEEMGIIRNVQNDTSIITDKIKLSINNTPSTPTSLDMTTYKNGSFQTDVTTSVDGIISKTKKQIDVKWHYYSFADMETQANAISRIPFRTKYNRLINTLFVVIFAIKGNIDSRTLEDSISHELTHNFQTQMKGNDLLTKEKDREKYQSANRNIGNIDKGKRFIATIIYLSHNFEQDAFLNGAYSYIMAEYQNGNDILSAYEDTEAYVSLHKMREYLDVMQATLKSDHVGENIKKYCIAEYGMTFEKIKNVGEKAYSRYSRKLARMYAQCLSDIRNKEINEGMTYHTMSFYTLPGIEETSDDSDYDGIFAD